MCFQRSHNHPLILKETFSKQDIKSQISFFLKCHLTGTFTKIRRHYNRPKEIADI